MPQVSPPVSVLRVLWQALPGKRAAQVMELASPLAFYAVRSVFPLLLVGTVVASWVVAASVVTAQLAGLVEGDLPRGIAGVLREGDADGRVEGGSG